MPCVTQPGKGDESPPRSSVLGRRCSHWSLSHLACCGSLLTCLLLLKCTYLAPQVLPAPSPSSPRPWPSWSLFDLGCPLLVGPALLGEVPKHGLSLDAQGQEQVGLEEELRRT